MKNRFITTFLSVVCFCVGAFADDEIKRGTYPYMAFIYYQDDTILDLSGGRFLQGAVLIRPSYLISSSPESTISADPLSKTLLARLGATVIDSKFSLNEDEDEQEQEIIQITRPHTHNSTRWWVTDICLLKTLQPIEPTKVVHFTQMSTKTDPDDKVCQIIIFKKKSDTDVRLLTRMNVEMLTASAASCGEKYVPNAMACASDQQSSEETQPPNDYCHGNSGGPLICDGNVMALQTYINGDCSAPHLYQLLAPRKRFLDCGTSEKCSHMECVGVCHVTLKDAPTTASLAITESTTMTTKPAETAPAAELTEPPEIPTFPTEPSTIPTTISLTSTTPMKTPTKSWPNEKEGRRKYDEDSDVLNRPANVEAQKQTPKLSGRANSNVVVFQSFVYSGFLLSICLI